MVNPSKIPNTTLWGKLLRLPLGLIPKKTVVRILQGPNKGFKWIKGSGNNSYWLGTYETDKQRAIKETLREGMVFYDIGAHVGFFSLLAARQVKRDGLVVAFEPLDRNVRYIEAHVALNKMENIVVQKGAVAETPGYLHFMGTGNTSGGHISDEGTVVPSYSIDGLVAGGMRKPDVVKIDVQGATLLVLRGMAKLLKDREIKLFIAIDNAPRSGLVPFSKRDVHDFLRSMGYEVVSASGEVISDDRLEAVNEIFAHKPSMAASA